MILIIDNYDSFVHNLARYIKQLGYPTTIIRNDALTIDNIIRLNPAKIVISPGPYNPDKAGISLEVVKQFGNSIPILGVCLGHQVIGQIYGAKIIRAKYPIHGKASIIHHTEEDIFKNLPNPLQVGRYHSLIVEESSLPQTLKILAKTTDNEIMAIRHRIFAVYGVQFHPESINTEYGYELLNNFLVL